MSSPTDDSTSNLEKQNNLGAACFRCRGFRHACDRRKPSCSRCYRRGITCVYPEAAPTLKKLQRATETLGDRIKKFGDRLKIEVAPVPLIDSQQAVEPNVTILDYNNVSSPSYTNSVTSAYSDDVDELNEEHRPRRRRGGSKVASMTNFSVYPCSKCFKDLQQCDLTQPKCSRCEANGFECAFKKTEPKANHVSQVLTTMNKVMDQWQDSIDRMAKDFAQKTKDFSARANNSLKIRPIAQQTCWKITSTKKGLSVESNVNSYNDFSTLVDQFKKSMTITPKDKANKPEQADDMSSHSSEELHPTIEFDDTSSIHTTSSFAIWNLWAHPTHAMPQDYPIDISQELTDNLVELYCRTPCCSSIRLPIIDLPDFLERYHNPDPTKRPSTVLVYAICAMAARNAFQLHVWSKRPSFEAPQYNMGKALSVAYCLRGRELLSECFDEPTFDNCQAAFLLSYCNYQNGYPGVIYFYEWIAYNMAQELGLYDSNRKLSPHESMLIWCIYYCNVWYKALQGSESNGSAGLSQCKPNCPLPDVVPMPTESESEGGEPSPAIINYYVWNSWVYLINLQVLRDQSMARLASFQSNRLTDTSLPQDLLSMQEELKEFHNSLPTEWQSLDTDMAAEESSAHSCCSPESPFLPAPDTPQSESDKHYNVDIKSFSAYCINIFRAHYSINQIVLYQAFVPMDKVPTSFIAIQSLETSLNAANTINRIFELMVQQKEECHVPLVGFLFANIIYRKLLSYSDDDYFEIGRSSLLRSVDISKASNNYIYDFEMTRTLVNVMEQEVQYIICLRSNNPTLVDSSSSASPSPSIPSPPNYAPLMAQNCKEW